ncbi:P-loop containing nucleoside triphosphate hydrolase protein [Rhizoclosmatium globosum]|uniref:p-loop containing nucleoside triphosphate hydrolase protein n=1 Tax=Rhizoclosmatium globosum TaxID=329046 RepID=A0A1Y2D3A1_9FUNG|nr:P-loop containing nucleoside triphosphate hydrolase protein [Rhizoclosmatium globosum]|eukprot:ORY53762.1 P-loop containing nucleoside triphosphate hydrolase protein [Rhizoclosmatium globosum]
MLGEESVDIGEKQDGKLWVDKYAPRMYVDLLGEERINREVLTWVKQWDHCVFKKPIKKVQPGGNPIDPYHRPEKKILLLSGPAGLGKTTLAHIVGRHSGYNVIEINASDDRTGESLRNKLIGAIESQSLNSKRPNLIIIDEIDGASASGGEEVCSFSKPTSSKRRVLLRPIICICNDQYAPVLRPLRAIAQTYAFRPPPHRILANRLTEICKQEGLQTDLRVLMTLCELTDGDIRSSLNTLQFFRRKTRVLTIEMLAGMEVGSKDMTRGLFRVWEDVFTIPSAKKKKKLGGGEDGDAGRYIHRLLALVSANGEVDKILQGCYENYLKMRVVDTVASTSDTTRSATKIEQALDWLVFHDRIDKFLIVDKDFELFKYQPFTIVNFYRLFAGISKPTIEFPRADYDNFVTRRMNENIVSMFMNTLSLSERVTWGNRARVLQELVTPLLQIISPDFRAVNVNLLKSNERIVLDRLVDVMVSFGLKFVQEKGEDGHYMFKLFP